MGKSQESGHAYGSKYDSLTDRSLADLDISILRRKHSLFEELAHLKKSYKPTFDKNALAMLLLAPTVVIPAVHYFYKGVIKENLSSNKRSHCEKLQDMVELVGTRDYHGQANFRSKMTDLFATFKSNKDDELMFLLMRIYQFHLEASSATRFFYRTDDINNQIRLFAHAALKTHFISDISNLILDFCKESEGGAPQLVPGKK